MAIENLFRKIDPVFVTNGGLKKATLSYGSYGFLSNPKLLEAIAQGEEKLDIVNGAGLFTDINHYPLISALGKSRALQEALPTLNEDVRRNTLVVFDATWAMQTPDGLLYINKPSVCPDGAVNGVRQIVEFFAKNPGRKMMNVAGTVFSKEGIITGAYEFQTEFGKIAELNEEKLRMMQETIYQNRAKVSSGLNILKAWELGIVQREPMINLRVDQYNLFSADMKLTQSHGRIFNPWLKGSFETSLTNKPELNELIMGWVFGVLPRGLMFPGEKN